MQKTIKIQPELEILLQFYFFVEIFLLWQLECKILLRFYEMQNLSGMINSQWVSQAA